MSETITKSESMSSKGYVKVIPLGGLGEIGKNMYVYETINDIIIIDCGLSFPTEEMLGVDIVIPDITYLEKRKDKIRGLVITHGHEDHIGGVTYFLNKINVPVYGTGLTLGILEYKLEEKKMLKKARLQKIEAGGTLRLGDFNLEFIHVNHSIADSLAIIINTPVGRIVHTGDFKVDYSPLYDDITDLTRLGELGKEGVSLLLMDSTNAEKPGKTQSERTIYRSFDEMFKKYDKNRITFATFSTNTNRIQTIFDLADKYNRKVALTGRSMLNIVDIAMKKGYITTPENLFIDIDDVNNYLDEEVVIITTGSQGESLSALSRMALSDHKKITLTEDDVVVMSAHAIPGNEKAVSSVINSLLDLGVTVVHDKEADVHVSGHGCQDELSLILTMTKPKYFMPMHGETRQLLANKKLAENIGMDKENIFVSDLGKVLVLTENSCKFMGEVPSGEVFVDGYGVGDVGSIVLRDRNTLSENGLVLSIITINNKTKKIVAGPDIVSRGFVYVKESEELINEIKQISRREAQKCLNEENYDWTSIKNTIRESLSKYIMAKTKRSPMILPIIISV